MTVNRIIITEARVAGLGINGGKRVRAAAVCHTNDLVGLNGLVEAELRHSGRARLVEVDAGLWVDVLSGGVNEAVLASMLEA